MSLATWKEEFYPIAAHKVAAEDALAHSLRKWRGLTPENLARHGVSHDSGYLFDTDEHLWINDTTCALCYLHLAPFEHHDCSARCPLAILRDGQACDQPRELPDLSPYSTFTEHGDPAPMIALIEAAIARSGEAGVEEEGGR